MLLNPANDSIVEAIIIKIKFIIFILNINIGGFFLLQTYLSDVKRNFMRIDREKKSTLTIPLRLETFTRASHHVFLYAGKHF